MSRFRPSRNYISGEVIFEGGPVDISGDLIVSGTITANEYNVNVINTNVTHIDADGNTKFGDTPDDTHQFTGSVFINGPLSASAIIGGGATTPDLPLNSIQFNEAGAFGGDPDLTWDPAGNALTVVGDITASVNVSGAFFYGDGSGLTGITATAAPAGSNTEIQFNADGVTAADADLVWLTGSNTLNVNGYISSSALFVSSSNSAETLLRVDSHNKPYLFTVDSSASLDGASRVMIRNSNDDTATAFNTSNRGLLHLEQLQTTTVNEAQGITVWSDTTGTIASQLRLVTFSPPAGIGSEVLFGTSNGHMAGPFVSDNQALGRLAYGGFDGNGFYYGALIYARATEAWNFSAQNGTELQFFLVPTGKGSSTNLAERIRFTSEGHLIVFPYSASNDDAIGIETNYDKSAGAPAIQVYGPSLFGSSSLNTHTFTGSVNISGALSASSNISGAFFYGDGSNLTNLPAGSPAGSNTQIQYNADGAFGADTGLVWASASNTLTVNGPLIITGSTSELQTPEIQFDVNHIATGHSTGRIYWDDDAKTLTADMQGSDVRLQIGQEEHVYVRNASGVTINNGDAVRISGAAGVNVQVEKAISEIKSFTLPTESDAILGVATEDILNNQSGYITTFGQVRDVDTSGFTAGDILYLSHTVSGSWTNTRPPAPYYPARVGIVEVVNATTGVILTRPAEPIFLGDIASITSSNVPIGVPSYLCYNDTTSIANFTNQLSGAFSGSYQGDGSLLESLNASNISAGTLDNARLPATISVTNVTASSLVSASLFYGDGSNLTGLARDFGPSATDPVGSPSAGDFYYNTVLNMTMHYDSSRTKWLSVETAEIHFGRNGNTGIGAYYRGINGRSYSDVQGRYAEHSGTIVSFSYTRGDTDAAVFNVTSGGTTVSFLSSSAIGGSTETLSDDFAADTVLGVRNQSADGNTTTDVLGVVRMKWRI